jgi:hypothetical protein
VSSASALVCQSACAAEAQRVAWNFVLADGYGGTCQLLSTVVSAQPAVRSITGLRDLEFAL